MNKKWNIRYYYVLGKVQKQLVNISKQLVAVLWCKLWIPFEINAIQSLKFFVTMILKYTTI